MQREQQVMGTLFRDIWPQDLNIWVGFKRPAETETSNLRVQLWQFAEGFLAYLLCLGLSVTLRLSLSISGDDQPWIYFAVLCYNQRPFLWLVSQSKYCIYDCLSLISRDSGWSTGVQ